jgi:hypothetical protein
MDENASVVREYMTEWGMKREMEGVTESKKPTPLRRLEG